MYKLIIGIVVVGIIVFFSISHNDSSSGVSSFGDYDESYYDDYDDIESLAYDHWEEVKEYLSGTETIDACSDSGCYTLDADISDGYVETLYFPNGGYIYPDAEIDESGYAEGYDYEGNYWEFQIDMGSSLVEDAIDDWASDYRENQEYNGREYYDRY
jgi:hypothetical protein